jgi:hypothetical protein
MGFILIRWTESNWFIYGRDVESRISAKRVGHERSSAPAGDRVSQPGIFFNHSLDFARVF